MKRAERSFRRARALLVGASLFAALASVSCGLANGAGLVGHLLYEDQIAICRHCAQQGELCADLDDGSWGCRPFTDFQSCDAARDLFEQHGDESPFLMPARGETALDEGFRSDCEGGKNPFVAEVLVYDFEYDTRLMTDWELADDGAERGELVTLYDADHNPHHPTSWQSQGFPSTDGSDIAYHVEMVFCVSVLFTEPVALQVADKVGHFSNPVCLDPPDER